MRHPLIKGGQGRVPSSLEADVSLSGFCFGCGIVALLIALFVCGGCACSPQRPDDIFPSRR